MEQTADLTLRWHLIGHLQSNKAKKAARFDVVHSIDEAGLLRRLDEAVEAAGRRVDLLVQGDLAGGGAKHGAPQGGLGAIFDSGRSARAGPRGRPVIIPPAGAATGG